MTDIPPPADDSHLFDDPAELAREWDDEAEAHFANRCKCRDEAECANATAGAMNRTTHYRRMAERGERAPRF